MALEPSNITHTKWIDNVCVRSHQSSAKGSEKHGEKNCKHRSTVVGDMTVVWRVVARNPISSFSEFTMEKLEKLADCA